MNNSITLELAIQQNCINLLSHKDFRYKFISKEDNLILSKYKYKYIYNFNNIPFPPLYNVPKKGFSL